MSYQFLVIALLAITVFTSLVTEAIKKLSKNTIKSPNIVAAIISVILSFMGSGVYCLWESIQINGKVIAEIILLIFLSFLCATVGYDKVIQAINQIRQKKG